MKSVVIQNLYSQTIGAQSHLPSTAAASAATGWRWCSIAARVVCSQSLSVSMATAAIKGRRPREPPGPRLTQWRWDEREFSGPHQSLWWTKMLDAGSESLWKAAGPY